MIICVKPHTPLSTKLNNNRNHRFYIVIGAKQPDSLERIVLNIVHLIPRPIQDYTLVFINTGASKDAYKDFFTAVDLLPM